MRDMAAGEWVCRNNNSVRSFALLMGGNSMAAAVDSEKCTGCEECISSCPLDAISMKEGVASVDEETCGDCGACVDACPSEAISLD
jgi:NAD-dependent dihydropyrimidine dehydrogenase PreA subunit